MGKQCLRQGAAPFTCLSLMLPQSACPQQTAVCNDPCLAEDTYGAMYGRYLQVYDTAAHTRIGKLDRPQPR